MNKRKLIVAVLVTGVGLTILTLGWLRFVAHSPESPPVSRRKGNLRDKVGMGELLFVEAYYSGLYTGADKVEMATGRLFSIGVNLADGELGHLQGTLDDSRWQELRVAVSELTTLLMDADIHSSWFARPRRLYPTETGCTLVLRWADKTLALRRPPYGIIDDAPDKVKKVYGLMKVMTGLVGQSRRNLRENAQPLVGEERDTEVDNLHRELAEVWKIALPREE